MRRYLKLLVFYPRETFARVARETGFTLAGHSIELFGRCPRCHEAKGELWENAQAE